MNNMDTAIESLGAVLTNNVDLEWLKSLEPRAFDTYVKFVVNPKTNKVAVGMKVHRNCPPEMGTESDLLGGNIFFNDGHIEYESTLNVKKNLDCGEWGDTPRVITNSGMIEQVDNILKAWVILP